MSKQDVFYKKVIKPAYYKLLEDLKITFKEDDVLSNYPDIYEIFVNNILFTRTDDTGCPKLYLTLEFQIKYPDITSILLPIITEFLGYVETEWQHQNN